MRSEVLHNLWPVKNCERAGVNHFSKVKNNIVLDTANSNIVFDCKIKTRDCWVAKVKIIHERTHERGHAFQEESITHSKQEGILMEE